jgi:hypothetical protein
MTEPVGGCQAVYDASLPSCTYNNGTAGVGATLTATSNGALPANDGYTFLLNDRVLIFDQSGTQNGIYVLTTVGDGSHPWVLTRATDFNTVAAINKLLAFAVINGTQYGGSMWSCDTEITTIGTDTIGFSLKSFPAGRTQSNYLPAAEILFGNSSNYATAMPVTGDITLALNGVGDAQATIATNVALAGSPTTTTQSSSDNSTKIATTAYVTSAVAASRIAPTTTKYTSGSGTYTTPTSPRSPLYIRVRMVGGGGGGSGSTASGASGAGGNGGTTTFGSSLLSAGGGSGGAAVTYNTTGEVGGAGGTSSLGSGPVGVALSGSGGGGGSQSVTSGIASPGGQGGSSAFGGAGYGAGNVVAGGAGATNTGGGGSGGGGTGPGTSGCGGGSGGFVDAMITSPAASYAYAVGSAGSAGTAGTSGYAGGAGGSGLIIVEEYYQ